MTYYDMRPKMRNRLKNTLLIGLFPLLSLQYSGCTVIGFAIGSGIYASIPDSSDVPPQKVMTVENSSQVTVTTKESVIYLPAILLFFSN